jgi:hypothetical protein
MNGRLFLAMSIGAVVAALVGGFLIVGGPLQARQDKADHERYSELQYLASALTCKDYGGRRGPSLPLELTVESISAHCSGAWINADLLADDETGEPYEYRRDSAQAFSLCATFHDASRTARHGAPVRNGALLDPATGCVSGTLR